MVFLSDFKKEFYDVIQNQRVLILVSLEVDSLCACKILQYLLKCDHVLYTIIPVSNTDQLITALKDNINNIQKIIMINCGGSIDIIQMLDPPPHLSLLFFISDSHRPIHVHNIYNQNQIKLIIKENEILGIPKFNDIFKEEEEEEEDEQSSDENQTNQEEQEEEEEEEEEEEREGEEEGGEGGGGGRRRRGRGGSGKGAEPIRKRRRFDEESLEKRRNKRIWLQNRETILFEYSEFTGWGTPSSLLMFELAWKLSKENNDLLWLSLVGVTEQLMMNKAGKDIYVDHIAILQPHVTRLNVTSSSSSSSSSSTSSINNLSIKFNQEPFLLLYKNWNLLESFTYSPLINVKFNHFTIGGRKRLYEFLAELGLPLIECKQNYKNMKSIFKNNFNKLLLENIEKYGICEQEIFIPTYEASFGFSHHFSTFDYILALQSLLFNIESTENDSGNFFKALDALDRVRINILEEGIEKAKSNMKILHGHLKVTLSMDKVINAGSFLYTFIQQSTSDSSLFTKPSFLYQLSNIILQAYCSKTKNKKVKNLPLVVGTLLPWKQVILLVGISPLSDQSFKNCFGKAFEQAAERSKSKARQNYFDSYFVEVDIEDRNKFFDHLITSLQI